MTIILVSQRVAIDEKHGERRDALDQRWHAFFADAGIVPILIPNHPAIAEEIISSVTADGILLTGGNDTPEREQTETLLLQHAITTRMPLLGVCHGMQVIQRHFGVMLHPVEGHVLAEQTIHIHGFPDTVNSYHDQGTVDTVAELDIWAKAKDGTVKAIRHTSLPIAGIMWHPERCTPFAPRDLHLFNEIFGIDL